VGMQLDVRVARERVHLQSLTCVATTSHKKCRLLRLKSRSDPPDLPCGDAEGFHLLLQRLQPVTHSVGI
jgi:hypothetical protein